MSRILKKKLLKVSSLLAAISVVFPSVKAAPTKIVYYNNNNNLSKILGKSAKVLTCLGAAGTLANEYFGMQGYSFCHPIFFNKGIDDTSKDGIAKHEIKTNHNENTAIINFFCSDQKLSKNSINFSTPNGPKFSEINSKFNQNKAERKKSACVILRNKTPGERYIGASGKRPYNCIIDMWKVLCENPDINLSNAGTDKSNLIYEYIEGLITSFDLDSFAAPSIKISYIPYEESKIEEVDLDTKETFVDGMLEIRLDFEKLNSGQNVSLSFYSPCTWNAPRKRLENSLRNLKNLNPINKTDNQNKKKWWQFWK